MAAPDFYNRRKGFQFGRKKGEVQEVSGVKLEHRIGVQAPAEVVWEILQDVPAWPTWNPIVTAAEGAVRIGERISLTRTLPGQSPELLQATVLDWTPNELLHLKRARLGGLVAITSYWEIEALAEASCVFSNGELFSGLLGPGEGKRRRGALRKGYLAACDGMKAKAEAAWRAPGRGAYIHPMIDDLYSDRLLALAANLPHLGRLAEPDGSSEKVAKLCGSRVVIDVKVKDGRVVDFAQDVKACALGQAAAAVLGAHILGAALEEIELARDAFRAMLKDGGPAPTGRFSDLSMLDAVKDYPARHASTLLAFEAAAEAVRQAAARTSPAGAA